MKPKTPPIFRFWLVSKECCAFFCSISSTRFELDSWKNGQRCQCFTRCKQILLIFHWFRLGWWSFLVLQVFLFSSATDVVVFDLGRPNATQGCLARCFLIWAAPDEEPRAKELDRSAVVVVVVVVHRRLQSAGPPHGKKERRKETRKDKKDKGMRARRIAPAVNGRRNHFRGGQEDPSRGSRPPLSLSLSLSLSLFLDFSLSSSSSSSSDWLRGPPCRCRWEILLAQGFFRVCVFVFVSFWQSTREALADESSHRCCCFFCRHFGKFVHWWKPGFPSGRHSIRHCFVLQEKVQCWQSLFCWFFFLQRETIRLVLNKKTFVQCEPVKASHLHTKTLCKNPPHSSQKSINETVGLIRTSEGISFAYKDFMQKSSSFFQKSITETVGLISTSEGISFAYQDLMQKSSLFFQKKINRNSFLKKEDDNVWPPPIGKKKGKKKIEVEETSKRPISGFYHWP